MFCSLMGLSPCDILLYDIDIKSVREAILALNNRFDSKYLRDNTNKPLTNKLFHNIAS